MRTEDISESQSLMPIVPATVRLVLGRVTLHEGIVAERWPASVARSGMMRERFMPRTTMFDLATESMT